MSSKRVPASLIAQYKKILRMVLRAQARVQRASKFPYSPEQELAIDWETGVWNYMVTFKRVYGITLKLHHKLFNEV